MWKYVSSGSSTDSRERRQSRDTVEKEDNREIKSKCSVLLPIWEGNEIIEQKKTIEKGFIIYLVMGWVGWWELKPTVDVRKR